MQARVLEHDSTGTGEPPIVFLPGGLTGWLTVASLVPALSRLRRTVRLQPLANAEGAAGRIGDPGYGADVERDCVAQTREAARVGEMHLVGWSNGGRMAIDFALAHPERVRSLILVEPAAWWLLGDDDPAAQAFDAFVARLGGREVSDEDVEEFASAVGLAPPGTDLRALPGWPTWSACRQTLSWYGPRMRRTAAEGIEGYERIAAPTLLIRGTATAPWLAAVVDVLAAAIPGARVVELAGGHASIIESAEGFVAAVAGHTGDR
jgi:pimeloyl-ACP methyl ester carboxylesterase